LNEIITTKSYPKVSIVTPSYNQGKFIEKTIRSVLCQDYLNLEYILVDGLSSDETIEVIKKYDNCIDVAIIEKDNGQAHALNKGFDLCTGDILAYLNSDDCYINKEVISQVVHYFNHYPDVDVIYGQRKFISENGQFVHFYPYKPFCKTNLYLSDYIPQECTFWRRSIFEKAGFFVDDTLHFAMDYELWLRFLKYDANFFSVSNFFGLFRYYESQKSNSQWHTLGVPEIARVHNIYTDKYISEKEMIDYYYEHFYGANPTIHAQAFNFCYSVWNNFVMHKRNILGQISLDEWVFHKELNIRKKDKVSLEEAS